MAHKVLVVGVGSEGPAGLPLVLQNRIAQADLLCGSERLLEHWAGLQVEKMIIRANIPELVERLRRRGEARVVVLASGDPGFYGIAGTLLRYLPADELEIVPHVTSPQLAFARAGIPWSDAIFTSAHARPLAEVVGWARRAPKLGILTDHKHTPALIAKTLLAAGIEDCRAIVAENLGLPDEQLTDTRLSALPGMEFSPLNVLLLIHDPDWRPQPVFAPRPAEAYAHRRGLITKAEVRALILARLSLGETDIAWDIGAGSGAVSIEMALLAWRGQVFAVEQNAENLAYLRENISRFRVLNVEVVVGSAPAALEGLPQPDAVFIGGSGGQMQGILDVVCRRLRPGGRIVLSVVTLENLNEAVGGLKARGFAAEMTLVNVARSKSIADLTRFEALTPVFVVTGTLAPGKGEEDDR
ncbi:MAG: precorrin-6y C5,15-methyltransferase (decarboxylating) subunit CbiE [Anaerolineae bacterium]|nr:precorrin-6y C5,15-methyltransferase (decarboxylating) subunit CbiE [Anaerolineae bacterium]